MGVTVFADGGETRSRLDWAAPTRGDGEMRRALLLVLLLSLAGCAADPGGDGVATAGGKPTGGASNAPAAADGDGLKFAQCMRENGMTWFSDPEPGQRGVRISVPQGQDKAKVDAAVETCKEFLPNGGEPPKMDPAALEQARQMSKCMRENGVPNFPDPGPDGEIKIDGNKLGTGPGEPDFEAAEKACARFQPSRPPGADGPTENRKVG
jgi:hypothetical protein